MPDVISAPDEGVIAEGSPNGSDAMDALLDSFYPEDDSSESSENEDEGRQSEGEEEEGKAEEVKKADEPAEIVALRTQLEDALKKVDEQSKALDRKMSEYGENFKKLREEAGIQDDYKADKEGRKAAEKIGADVPDDYVWKNYIPQKAFDDEIDKAVKANNLHANDAAFLKKNIRPLLDSAINIAVKEARADYNKKLEDIREEYEPLKTKDQNNTLNAQRVVKLKPVKEKIDKTYPKLHPLQIKAFQEEINMKDWFSFVDASDADAIFKRINRAVNDPDVLAQIGEESRKEKKEKKSSTTTREPTNDEQRKKRDAELESDDALAKIIGF